MTAVRSFNAAMVMCCVLNLLSAPRHDSPVIRILLITIATTCTVGAVYTEKP